jgi:hypothetical protein
MLERRVEVELRTRTELNWITLRQGPARLFYAAIDRPAYQVGSWAWSEEEKAETFATHLSKIFKKRKIDSKLIYSI